MNIFVLSEHPGTSAEMHCDKHCVKMVLESTQLLCTYIRETNKNLSEGDKQILYKSTHANHPCSVWLRENTNNVAWLLELAWSLSAEYTFRYKKYHKCREILKRIGPLMSVGMRFTEHTPFPLCMPDAISTYANAAEMNAPDAYRLYYASAKRHICTWKRGDTPYWWKHQCAVADCLFPELIVGNPKYVDSKKVKRRK